MLACQFRTPLDVGEEKSDRTRRKTTHLTLPRSYLAPGSGLPPGRAFVLLRKQPRTLSPQAKPGAELRRGRNPAGGMHLSQQGNSLANCERLPVVSLRVQRFENRGKQILLPANRSEGGY